MTELTVTACPEKHLAFTNSVYCSTSETSLLKSKTKPNYAVINDVVFTIEGHAKINPGELGLSALQRETLKVAQAAKVQAKVWTLPQGGAANLVRLHLNCELVGQGRKTLTEKEVSEHILLTFNNAIFNLHQTFITDYIGTTLKMSVKDLQIPHIDADTKGGSDGVTVRAARGLLMGEVTEVEVDSEPPNKYLTFVKEKKKSFLPQNFKFEDMGIGGLDAEFNLLFRRAFASRIFPQKLVQQLGIKHVKGMLLYGPPGTGKTLIARQIGKMLATREPKIVNGPEVLNKFVGQSEENIRKLFQDAEEDQKANGDGADLHMIIFDEIDAICVAEGTPVDMADGTSVPIEAVVVGAAVRSFDRARGGLTDKAVDARYVKGVKECVELLFEDGRQLVCTPDHRILTARGWVEARDVQLEQDLVVCGHRQPLAVGDAQQGWSLRLSHLDLTLTDAAVDAGRVAAFARLLGHLVSDGSVTPKLDGWAYLGHALDGEAVLNDVELLTGARPAIYEPSGVPMADNTYRVALPRALVDDAVACGIRPGRKCADGVPVELPHVLDDPLCPRSFKREFLAALFGGDGVTPVPQPHGQGFSALRFVALRKPSQVSELQRVMDQLCTMLAEFGIERSWMTAPRAAQKLREDEDGADVVQAVMAEAAEAGEDVADSMLVSLKIGVEATTTFASNVGFRYSAHKQQRMAVVASYYNMRQHATKAKESTLRDIVLNSSDIKSVDCHNLSVDAFLAHVGAAKMFAAEGASRDAGVLPMMSLRVVARRDAGPKPVYDLSVPDTFNFSAMGVVVHNCKARGAKSGGDSGVGDTVVNQLLSKMDGVNSLNNILVIGMTNRKDLIDPALLRPGRLEVHIEISLPDEKGRVQILNIHTKTMRENGRLSKDVDIFHLAAVTKNFSGAELEGLVKSATSFALYQAVDLSGGSVGIQKEKEKDIKVTAQAFEHALEEVKPSFGVDEDELAAFIGDLYDYGDAFEHVMAMGRGFIDQTTIAAKLARDSGFPFVRMIRPSQYLGMTELSKTARIAQIFEDAYKSPLSCIVIDSLENLIEYIPVGPRFSNATLQTLIAFCSQPPPHADRKLLVFATTNKPDMLRELGFESLFQGITVPSLTESEEVKRVLDLLQCEVEGGEQEKELIALSCPVPMSIKTLLNKVDFYTRGNKANPISADIWKV